MVIHSCPKSVLVTTLSISTYEPFKSTVYGIGSIIVGTRTLFKGEELVYEGLHIRIFLFAIEPHVFALEVARKALYTVKLICLASLIGYDRNIVPPLVALIIKIGDKLVHSKKSLNHITYIVAV